MQAFQAIPPPLAMGEDGGVRVAGTRVQLEIVVAAFDAGATAKEIVQLRTLQNASKRPLKFAPLSKADNLPTAFAAFALAFSLEERKRTPCDPPCATTVGELHPLARRSKSLISGETKLSGLSCSFFRLLCPWGPVLSKLPGCTDWTTL